MRLEILWLGVLEECKFFFPSSLFFSCVVAVVASSTQVCHNFDTCLPYSLRAYIVILRLVVENLPGMNSFQLIITSSSLSLKSQSFHYRKRQD